MNSDLNTTEIEIKPIIRDVSILIPTLGRDTLEKCLLSLACADSWPECIIVIDQGDNSAVGIWRDTLRNAGMKIVYLKLSIKGIARAMNLGIDHVLTTFINVTHDDCVVATDWLTNMNEQLEKNPDTIISGRVEPGSEGVVLSVNTRRRPVIYNHPLLTEDILYPCNMGFSVKTYKQIGPFDESPLFTSAAEDNDWAYRALRNGIQIIYAPEVTVFHADWRDEETLISAYKVYAQAQGAFYGKYLRNGDLFMALRAGLNLISAPWKWMCGIIEGNDNKIIRGRAFTLYLLSGIINGLKEEKHHNE